MLDILNKILTSQLDPEAVMAKLDEISSIQGELDTKKQQEVSRIRVLEHGVCRRLHASARQTLEVVLAH
jgi:hypothetical protein